MQKMQYRGSCSLLCQDPTVLSYPMFSFSTCLQTSVAHIEVHVKCVIGKSRCSLFFVEFYSQYCEKAESWRPGLSLESSPVDNTGTEQKIALPKSTGAYVIVTASRYLLPNEPRNLNTGSPFQSLPLLWHWESPTKIAKGKKFPHGYLQEPQIWQSSHHGNDAYYVDLPKLCPSRFK